MEFAARISDILGCAAAQALGCSFRHFVDARCKFFESTLAGALLFFAGVSFGGEGLATSMVTWVLAFSAGVFLCVALSDRLPEMEFHTHSRIPLSLALIAGVLSAYAIGLLEDSAAHAPESEETSDQNDLNH